MEKQPGIAELSNVDSTLTGFDSEVCALSGGPDSGS